MNVSLRGLCLLVVFTSAIGASPVFAEQLNLPHRVTPKPVTTDGVPHIQKGVQAVPEISAELLRRVSTIPGVELHDTIVSQSGATGFWLNDEVALVRPDVIVRGREFAHLHPDGSLHTSLPPEVAAMAIQAGWGVYHPWADERPGWEGFVMIYTPVTKEELEVVLQLIMETYRFVTGKDMSLTEG